jgi:ATP-dependent Zn protease
MAHIKVKDFLTTAMEQAEDILQRNWIAVQKLADALLKRPHINGEFRCYLQYIA